MIGTAHAGVYLEGFENKWFNNLAAKIGSWIMNNFYLNKIQNHADFLGIQYYSRGLLKFSFKGVLPNIEQVRVINQQSDMGWEVYPQGLYNYIRILKKYNKPFMLTENGIADKNDTLRETYIKEYLKTVHQVIQEGTPVLGYLYWSFIDNLEWDKGFWPKFGLVEFNKQTFERTVRPSAIEYGKIAKDNGLYK